MVIDLARLKDCLELWRDWMRHDDSRLGYPQKSMGISSGGVNCWDDLGSDCDNYTVQIIDAAMSSLTESGRQHMVDAIQISMGILPNNWRYHYQYDMALQFAHEFVWRKMVVAGVV